MTLIKDLNSVLDKKKSLSSAETEYARVLNQVLDGSTPVSATVAWSVIDGIKKLYQSKELSQEFEHLLAVKHSDEQMHTFLKKFVAYAFPKDNIAFEHDVDNVIEKSNFIHALTEGIKVDFKYSTPTSLWEMVNIVYRYCAEAQAIRKAKLDMQNTELPPLTPREREVLTYLGKGFTIKEIAEYMGIKWFTVNDHIKMLYKKLNVSSRAEAAVLASKNGLI